MSNILDNFDMNSIIRKFKEANEELAQLQSIITCRDKLFLTDEERELIYNNVVADKAKERKNNE